LVVRFLFVTYGAENPTIGWRSAVACKRLRYAPCLSLQLLRVA